MALYYKKKRIIQKNSKTFNWYCFYLVYNINVFIIIIYYLLFIIIW